MNNVVVVNVKLINVSFTPQKCIKMIKSSYKGIPEITCKEFGSTIVRVVSLAGRVYRSYGISVRSEQLWYSTFRTNTEG